ncbi:MAG: efflux RND transporter periplasmic adaptor subunit [Polyangiales bacterium]
MKLSAESAAFIRSEVAPPAKGEHSRAFVARVAYDERHVARLGPPVQGRVASINVVTGDKVKPGTLLLTLTAPEIATAQAELSRAKTETVMATRAAERASVLLRDGAGSEAERLHAEAALAQAKNEEKRATAAIAAIGGVHGASNYQLRSPIAGMVVERNASVGSEVHAGQEQPLVTVADLSTVWVVADIYEQDLARVHEGDEVTVSVLTYPGRKFQGKIKHVGGRVDPLTRAALARVEFDNADLALRPGMFARMEVRGAGTGATQVPTSAVLARRDQFFVFIASADGTYVQREVKIGEQFGQHTTILDGVAPGERVVTEGAILLDAEANEML